MKGAQSTFVIIVASWHQAVWALQQTHSLSWFLFFVFSFSQGNTDVMWPLPFCKATYHTRESHHSETLPKLWTHCETSPFIYFFLFFFLSPTCQSTPASSAATRPELRAVPVGSPESNRVVARLTGGVGSGLPVHACPPTPRLEAADAAAVTSPSPANSRAFGLEHNSFQPCVVS